MPQDKRLEIEKDICNFCTTVCAPDTCQTLVDSIICEKGKRLLDKISQEYVRKDEVKEKIVIEGYAINSPLCYLFYECPGNHRIELDSDVYTLRSEKHTNKIRITIEALSTRKE